VGEALRWRAGRRRSRLRGDELARRCRSARARARGLLAELEEAAFAGEVSTPAEAVALARELVGRAGPDGEE
jgi:hypothetical protein